MAQLVFNANTVAPSTGVGDPIPKGWYNAIISESEMKPTKANDGSYLQLVFKVVDGHYAGRQVWERYNLYNPNDDAVRIAYEDLSAIMHAIGVLDIQDSTQLHDKPLKIKVKIRPGNDGYEDSNEITAYRNVNEQVELVQGPGGTTSPQSAPVAPPQQPGGFAPPAQQPQQQPQAQSWAQGAPQQQPAQQPAQQPQAGAQGQPWQQAAPVQQEQPQQAVHPQGGQPWSQPAQGSQPWGQPQQQQPAQQEQPQQPQQQQAPVQQAAQQPQQQPQPTAQPATGTPGGQPPPWAQPAS